MKKISLFFALSTVVLTVFAQDSKFIVGLEAALIRTDLLTEDVDDEIKPINSISPGLYLEYLLNSKFSLKSGLAYERKGWAGESTRIDSNLEPIGTQDIILRFDYLTIPVMASYSTKGTVRFYVNGGTIFGFLLSHTVTLGEFGDEPEQTIDIKGDLKTFDFGLSIGCGLFLPLGERFAFDFGLRDNLGLIDIFKADFEKKSRMNTIGIVASLKYRL